MSKSAADGPEGELCWWLVMSMHRPKKPTSRAVTSGEATCRAWIPETPRLGGLAFGPSVAVVTPDPVASSRRCRFGVRLE